MIATQVLYSVEMGLLLLAMCVLIGPIVAEPWSPVTRSGIAPVGRR